MLRVGREDCCCGLCLQGRARVLGSGLGWGRSGVVGGGGECDCDGSCLGGGSRGLHSSASLRSGGKSYHVETSDNTPDHVFDFTPENYVLVERILAKFPEEYKKGAMLPLLDLAQRQCNNFLPVAAMKKVARILGVSDMAAFEVASFYTMYNRERVGKYFIQLCGTTPCMVCGSEEIKEAICSHLDIEDGGTTPDGLFTLREVECLGACANAPMVQINDDFYENLTKESIVEVIEACKKGTPPQLTKWGSKPMNGQLSCEGPQGPKTLTKDPPKPASREISKKVDPATVKEAMMY